MTDFLNQVADYDFRKQLLDSIDAQARAADNIAQLVAALDRAACVIEMHLKGERDPCIGDLMAARNALEHAGRLYQITDKLSHYDGDIDRWIYLRLPSAWSCHNEANGDGRRCPEWCRNLSRCIASFSPKGANTEFIVRACNSHQKLVNALTELLRTTYSVVDAQTRAEAKDAARAALAKATGGES